jgi:hypothetical protein
MGAIPTSSFNVVSSTALALNPQWICVPIAKFIVTASMANNYISSW